MNPDNFIRWNDGATDVTVAETDGGLTISSGRGDDQELIVRYAPGEIRSVIDRHSVGTCTLTVVSDDGSRHAFDCSALVCAVLMVKLRKFQRADPAGRQAEEALAGSR